MLNEYGPAIMPLKLHRLALRLSFRLNRCSHPQFGQFIKIFKSISHDECISIVIGSTFSRHCRLSDSQKRNFWLSIGFWLKIPSFSLVNWNGPIDIFTFTQTLTFHGGYLTLANHPWLHYLGGQYCKLFSHMALVGRQRHANDCLYIKRLLVYLKSNLFLWIQNRIISLCNK